MPTYKCRVIEEVVAEIDLDIEAASPEEAAKLARRLWVGNGTGQLSETVKERWVEVDGEFVETSDEDEDEL